MPTRQKLVETENLHSGLCSFHWTGLRGVCAVESGTGKITVRVQRSFCVSLGEAQTSKEGQKHHRAIDHIPLSFELRML